MLALLALLLCVVAGVLLIIDSLHIPHEMSVQWLVDVGLKLILGLVLIVAGLVAYGGRYMEGGILALIIGVVVILRMDVLAGLLAVVGGIMALVAERP